MHRPDELKDFLGRIMHINVTSMGGAAAGIIGSSDASNDILFELKKSSVTFAREYMKKERDQEQFESCAAQIAGYLQILQVTSTLSRGTTEELIGRLDNLMGIASA